MIKLKRAVFETCIYLIIISVQNTFVTVGDNSNSDTTSLHQGTLKSTYCLDEMLTAMLMVNDDSNNGPFAKASVLC